MLTQSPSAYFAITHSNFTDRLIQNFSVSFPSAQLHLLRAVVPQRIQLHTGTAHTLQRRSHQFYLFTVSSKPHFSHRLCLTYIRNWYWPLAVCKFLIRAQKAGRLKRRWTSGNHCSRDHANQFSDHIRSTSKRNDVSRDPTYLDVSWLGQICPHRTLVRLHFPLINL